MPATTLEPTATKELRQLLDRLATTAGESLASLVARAVSVQVGETTLTDAASLLPTLARPQVVVRANFGGEAPDRLVALLFETRDACTLTGLLLMTADEVVAERRAGAILHADDAQAFQELANIVCSALAALLKDVEIEATLQFQDLGAVPVDGPQALALPADPLVACRMRMQITGYPEGTAYLLLDEATASAWNRAPVDPAAAEADATAGGSRSDEDLTDIPAAPVRGALHAYLGSNDAMPTLRRSSRRVGLDLRRHNRAEVPNPAAHRGEIVVMDVPAGQYRQFDWCRRIKEFATDTKVVLLLHHPSRARVTHAFLARADVILGLPLAEESLSAKLKELLDR